MIVVGITGSVGTGKSTVAKMLKECGAEVIDADHLAHEAIQPRQPAWRCIIKTFGRTILKADGSIDRLALGQRVFRDAKARRRLERIIHPDVIRRTKARLSQWRRQGRVRVAVLDVPLLVEAGMHKLVDRLVVVTAPAAIQRQRLKARGWSEPEIRRRIAAQWKLSAKVALADVVIDNAAGLLETQRQVKDLWNTQLVGQDD
ncbi:MAG: dephospho-CoA kinase [Candidatus Omnitrophica bacterium]|nr:dephospho-CoA kinase [Candidatus Omnitrophota bacterium]